MLLDTPKIPKGVKVCEVPIFNTNRFYRVNRKFNSEKDVLSFINSITEYAPQVRYFVKEVADSCWVLCRMSAIGKKRVCWIDSKKNITGGCRDLGIRGAFLHEYIGQGNDCNIPLDQVKAEKQVFKFAPDMPYQIVRFTKHLVHYDNFTYAIDDIKERQEKYPQNTHYLKYNDKSKLWDILTRQPIGFVNDTYSACVKDLKDFKDDRRSHYMIEYKGHKFK